MCSEVRGEEATAGTLLCRLSENVAAPKVHKHMAAQLDTLLLLSQKQTTSPPL